MTIKNKIQNFIPLASPDIRQTDIDSVVSVLRSGNLVQGIKVQELEAKLSRFLNIQHCIMLSNGTSTLHASLLALSIGPGDEVIVPAFSYIATANVIELVGATPVFVDICIDTFNIQIEAIESAITPNTKAIMIVHEFGLMADAIKIKEICDRYNLHLIEDAACALGAKEEDNFAGTIGKLGSFSFHPRKAITCGEGGAVVTDDSKLANKIRVLRNHGIDSTVSNKMNFVDAGYNYRLTDFQAALLSSQFDRISQILKRKSEIASRYLEEITNTKFKLPNVYENKTPSWQTFHVLLNDPLKQAEVVVKLKELGIGVNYGAQCIPEQIFYKKKYGYNSSEKFPNALKAFVCGLAIPVYEKLTEKQVTKIIETINIL